ncbi:uncharacterized protein LOC114298725 [Camellia sinensis]|uniref:uncharacterized protein LOC114298725 n=1 Tax=Camellia sinensis TaxID=4442 RepID=UPI001036B459|nr:uncharacterized protein LOC114298725 [Camellia sinensis]
MLKSFDSQALGRTNEVLRDYLQRKRNNANVTFTVQPRSPFSVELDEFKAPKRFNMLKFQIYDSKSDPNFYVGLYLNAMSMWSGNEQLLCKVFPSTFGEITSDWFLKLLKGLIKRWEGWAEMFVARLMMQSLRAYAKRFYELYNWISTCNQELAVVSFKNDLEDDCLLQQSLAKTLPKSMEDLMARIEKYACEEDDKKSKK